MTTEIEDIRATIQKVFEDEIENIVEYTAAINQPYDVSLRVARDNIRLWLDDHYELLLEKFILK